MHGVCAEITVVLACDPRAMLLKKESNSRVCVCVYQWHLMSVMECSHVGVIACTF